MLGAQSCQQAPEALCCPEDTVSHSQAMGPGQSSTVRGDHKSTPGNRSRALHTSSFWFPEGRGRGAAKPQQDQGMRPKWHTRVPRLWAPRQEPASHGLPVLQPELNSDHQGETKGLTPGLTLLKAVGPTGTPEAADDLMGPASPHSP